MASDCESSRQLAQPVAAGSGWIANSAVSPCSQSVDLGCHGILHRHHRSIHVAIQGESPLYGTATGKPASGLGMDEYVRKSADVGSLFGNLHRNHVFGYATGNSEHVHGGSTGQSGSHDMALSP